jgi:DNA-binding transcriptional ArsR family regulator
LAAARRATVGASPGTPTPARRPRKATRERQAALLPALVPDPPADPPTGPPAPAQTHDQRVLVPLGVFDWQRVIRSADVEPMTKLVGLTASTYASKNGSSVRPGERLLADDCGLGQSTVRKHLARLVGLGLLELVSRGGGPNRLASEYRLVAPEGTRVTRDRNSGGERR